MKRVLQILIVIAVFYALWAGGTALEKHVLDKGHQMMEEGRR
jgi:hypothetical protein